MTPLGIANEAGNSILNIARIIFYSVLSWNFLSLVVVLNRLSFYRGIGAVLVFVEVILAPMIFSSAIYYIAKPKKNCLVFAYIYGFMLYASIVFVFVAVVGYGMEYGMYETIWRQHLKVTLKYTLYAGLIGGMFTLLWSLLIDFIDYLKKSFRRNSS